jgi:hypothetical protein
VSKISPLDDFDRGKPFFPLAMLYVQSLRAPLDLVSQGVVAHIQPQLDSIGDLQRKVGIPSTLGIRPNTRVGDEVVDGAIDEIEAGLDKLRGPLSLLSECDGGRIDIPASYVFEQYLLHRAELMSKLIPVAGSVLTFAWALVEVQLTDAERAHPLLQFLKHVRNAVAHSGRFNFQSPKNLKKPRRQADWQPAIWRGLVISRSMEGSFLFRDGTAKGLLSPGDPLWLLWDIEKAYPNLKA